jgi:hypothetical protein
LVIGCKILLAITGWPVVNGVGRRPLWSGFILAGLVGVGGGTDSGEAICRALDAPAGVVETMGVEHGRADVGSRLEEVFAAGDFPARRDKFPVPDYREFEATIVETLGNLGPNSLKGARNRRNSLYFPCITGIRPRDQLPPDSVHPLESSSPQTPSTAIESARAETLPIHPGNYPEISAIPRVLAVEVWRIRTGDGRFRAR